MIDEVNAAVVDWKHYADEVAVEPILRDQIAKALIRFKYAPSHNIPSDVLLLGKSIF